MQQVISRIRLVAVYVAVLLPVIIYGAMHTLQSSNNSPIDWVDSTFSERKQFDEFVELFGPGDVVIASRPEYLWTDKRLDRLTLGLRKSKAFRSQERSPLFHQVVSGRETLLRMKTPPETTSAPFSHGAENMLAQSSVTNESAGPLDQYIHSENSEHSVIKPLNSGIPLTEGIRRLQGTMIDKDGKTTWIVVTFNAVGLKQRTLLVNRLRRAIHVCCDVDDSDIHLAGPVIDGMSVDEASHASLTTFAGPLALVIFIICWWSLGSLLAGTVVFLTASFCQAVLLAIIYYSGEKLSAILIILPPLVQVLTVSGGIHLMNYT